MKILIITGELASPLVKKIAKKSKEEVIVHVAKTQIAAFLTPNKIIKEINKYFKEELSTIDMILTPGLIRKDVGEIATKLNVPTFKGSSDCADLEMVINSINKLNLSAEKAADKLIEEEKRKQAIKFIKDYENNKTKIKSLLEKEDNILIKNLPAGSDFPMRVLGEIASAPSLNKEELTFKAQYYIDNGADMIDIGMIAGEDNSDKIPELIATLRKIAKDKPLSIDTLNPKEIKVAIENNIDLVLSLDLGNCEELIEPLKAKNIPAVILPTNFKEGIVPHTVEERLKNISKLIKKCKGVNVIADLILDPINSISIVDSIIAAHEFRKKHNIPLFFGVGNVTELLDVDSTGVNGLLSGIAMELKANILFTPDESGKTWNSIYELAISSKMMFLAKHRSSIPKDLGITLVTFKDKKKRENIEEEPNDVELIQAKNDPKFIHDPYGSFKIIVEHDTRYDKSRIIVSHFKKGEKNLTIYGTESQKIFNEIIERKLVSRKEHCAYLGSELQKAEIAMITGKEYVQDFELFKKPFIL
ncbi:dihydropteroate synthase-like protein [Methanobrevibacter filiformis]|uniref:Methyltetrahydrofolate:corrinoid/iron-sulfur protein methyltransferase n=1 Tax=Methanobrevibacter filiformis TaxID=55758 RepID=A0A165Z0W3_9EURY|nr:dihydropteroate synthase-like protein [Methanobrevibacter filiformis]KZX10106.1 methyltetrahydrofolate:corrinoid/iron-sulfur protein methyltransferase [Methanobrevibacter filiformis]